MQDKNPPQQTLKQGNIFKYQTTRSFEKEIIEY